MRAILTTRYLGLGAAAVLALATTTACGDDDDDSGRIAAAGGEAGDSSGGDGGSDTGGTTGEGGSETGGTGGTTGGTAGEAGSETGGTAGEAGSETGGTAGEAGSETGGTGGTTGGTAGEAGSETGGTGGTTGGSGGEAGSETGGTGGTIGGSGGEAGSETGGTGGTVGADIDDLIGAICDWEFRCCDAGEIEYRLSPFVTDAASCRTRFVYELRESNGTNNPYVSGSATGLLGTLAYTVNLARVTPNAQGVADCIDAYAALGCNVELTGLPHCTATALPGEDVCALVNLLDPALEPGDQCTLGLTQGAGNDVECPAGSTCLPAADPDNPADFPACVTRGVATQPCTNDSDCDYDFYCATNGTCTAKGEVDDACTFNDPDAPAPFDEDAGCKAGLRCNPLTLTCVANCTIDYVCSSDLECPAGQSCAPVTVDDDTTSFHVCRTLGTTAADRCDDDADCVAGRFCNGGVCGADLNIGDTCATQAQCEAGTFCDTAIISPDVQLVAAANVCVTLFQPGTGCYPLADVGNWPNGCTAAQPQCIYDATDARFECAATKLALGADCHPPFGNYRVGDGECQSGLCEVVEAAGSTECTSGAGPDDDCDDDVLDETALRCAAGLFCLDGTCVAQADPGGDCEDPDTAAENNNLCKNSVCADQWEALMCTDAPVPRSAGGTNVTCDGA